MLAYGRVVLDDADVALDDERATDDAPPDLAVPPTRAEADELMLVSRWLQQGAQTCAATTRVGVAASRLPPIARYTPGARGLTASRS